MLWDINSDMCGQYCRVWNTSVKLIFNVPRSCHTYLVQNVLAPEHLPIRTELMSRFVTFYKRLTTCPSYEVNFLAKIVLNDVRSTTKKNLSLIEKESCLDPLSASPQVVKCAVSLSVNDVPRNQEWRLRLLKNLLEERRLKESTLQNTEIISGLIDSLCSS